MVCDNDNVIMCTLSDQIGWKDSGLWKGGRKESNDQFGDCQLVNCNMPSVNQLTVKFQVSGFAAFELEEHLFLAENAIR